MKKKMVFSWAFLRAANEETDRAFPDVYNNAAMYMYPSKEAVQLYIDCSCMYLMGMEL